MFCLLLLFAFAEVELENGLRINYQESGEGPPILLLGGLGSRLQIWDDLTPLLEKKHRVIRMDHRGIGGSGDLKTAYTLETMADDAAGLMEKLGFKHYHVAGISLGSFVAQKIALKYPKRVHRLILIASSMGGQTHTPPDQEVMGFWMRMASMPRADLVQSGLTLSTHPSFKTRLPQRYQDHIAESIAYVPPPQTIQRQSMVGLMFNHGEAAKKITSSTLIIHGDADRIVPYPNASKLHALIPNSKMVTIADCGHLSIIEHPQMVADEILAWLAKK